MADRTGLGNFSCLCCRLFKKNTFRNTIRMSNGLDRDHDRCSVGPELGPNWLSADNKSGLARNDIKDSKTIRRQF